MQLCIQEVYRALSCFSASSMTLIMELGKVAGQRVKVNCWATITRTLAGPMKVLNWNRLLEDIFHQNVQVEPSCPSLHPPASRWRLFLGREAIGLEETALFCPGEWAMGNSFINHWQLSEAGGRSASRGEDGHLPAASSSYYLAFSFPSSFLLSFHPSFFPFYCLSFVCFMVVISISFMSHK